MKILYEFIVNVGTESETNNHDSNAPDLVACPPVPPRKHRRRHTPPRPPSNGLPPTPKVHMGACFSKVDFFTNLNCVIISLHEYKLLFRAIKVLRLYWNSTNGCFPPLDFYIKVSGDNFYVSFSCQRHFVSLF